MILFDKAVEAFFFLISAVVINLRENKVLFTYEQENKRRYKGYGKESIKREVHGMEQRNYST